MEPAHIVLLLCAGLWAGAQNALAGGGSFITIPALMLAGLDARSANITSSVALYPGQVATGVAGRSMVSGTETLSFQTMALIGLIGGALGSALLLLTPGATFEGLLPWLVLFATAMFGWSAFSHTTTSPAGQPVARWVAIAIQGAISIYGGYFGGGLGFLMVASLSLVGLTARTASATKNALACCLTKRCSRAA